MFKVVVGVLWGRVWIVNYGILLGSEKNGCSLYSSCVVVVCVWLINIRIIAFLSICYYLKNKCISRTMHFKDISKGWFEYAMYVLSPLPCQAKAEEQSFAFKFCILNVVLCPRSILKHYSDI